MGRFHRSSHHIIKGYCVIERGMKNELRTSIDAPFRDWEGEPLVVVHGMWERFKVFRWEKLGRDGDASVPNKLNV